MTTITVKNIPDELYDLLRETAAANRRSINSEIIVAIEGAVKSKRINVDEMLATARRFRQLTVHHPVSNEELNELKRAGRE